MSSSIYEYLKNSNKIVGIDKKIHPYVPTYKDLDEIKDVDVVIDFSGEDGYLHLLKAISRKINVFSGTTNYTLEQIKLLQDLAKENNTIFVWKPNFAKGVDDLLKLVNVISTDFDSCDIIEIHAATKIDIPSGTAKMIKEVLNNKNDIKSLRLEKTNPIHEIIFYGGDERIIVTHEILNKQAFVKGLINEMKKCGVDVE